MNEIILLYDDYGQVPDQQDYLIDSTFDKEWSREASQILDELSAYFNITKNKLLKLVEMAEYHHGLNRHHFYIYKLSLVDLNFLNFFRDQAARRRCFFELECYDGNEYFGLISISKTHFVFNSVAQESGLPSISGAAK